MSTPTLTQMDNTISHLSLSEQIWLMERLVQRIKENAVSQTDLFEDELVAMANDPDIQRELHAIENDFALTEADGLTE